MKTKNLLFAALIAVIMTSCMSSSYFQVYKATPTSKTTLKGNVMIYEDENCIVSYNLWGEGGNMGFSFYNKTSKNIYLNLEESFFILNGMSNNYYQNRVFTNTQNSGISSSRAATASKSMTGVNYLDLFQTNRISATNSVGIAASSGYSVSYNEEKIVCIPSMTSKVITEYSIKSSLFRDCDLYRFPTGKQIKSKTFIKSNSPLVFSNRIVYNVEQSIIPVKFENEFFVTEITNYPSYGILENKYEEFCGEKSMVMTEVFKNISPDKFYIKYSKEKYRDSFSDKMNH